MIRLNGKNDWDSCCKYERIIIVIQQYEKALLDMVP